MMPIVSNENSRKLKAPPLCAPFHSKLPQKYRVEGERVLGFVPRRVPCRYVSALFFYFKIVIIFSLSLLLLSCGKKRVQPISANEKINIEHEKVLLHNYKNYDNLKKIAGWPEHKSNEDHLFNIIKDSYKNMEILLRENQKYGLYTVVTTADNPTVEIFPSLKKFDFENDSMFYSVDFLIKNKSKSQQFARNIRGKIAIKNKQADTFKTIANAFHELNRSFPYNDFLSFFLTNKPSN